MDGERSTGGNCYGGFCGSVVRSIILAEAKTKSGKALILN